jgi:Na+/melibiose symporter-like transporter
LLRDWLGLSYAQIGLLFSAGALSGMILEPVVSFLSNWGSKRWWVIGGALGVASSLVFMATARSFGLMLFAFALYWPSWGAAGGLAEATLIEAAPQQSTRTMTRWTLMASIGDLLSPLTVAAIVALQLGWPGLCWLGAALWLCITLLLLVQHFPHPAHVANGTDDTVQVKVWARLREALRDPLLLRWIVLALIPIMMDEDFLGFVSLYLRDVLHASQAIIGVILTVAMGGTLLGLVALDRLFDKGRIAPRRLLVWLALLTLLGMAGLLATRSIWFAAVSLFVISLGAAGWYPIAKAEAYARQPARSGTVRTVSSLGRPLEVALPGVVGFIAGRFGVLASVGFLGLAPVLILLLVPRPRK